MSVIVPNKKQTLSLAHKYKLYLSKWPKSKDKLSNKHNIFADLNAIDKAMMRDIKKYLTHKSHQKGGLSVGGENMPKDRGRKAIKKPKQLKVKTHLI